MKHPYAFRPLRRLYIAIGEIVSTDQYLSMTEKEFVTAVMKSTGCSANPNVVRDIFSKLKRDSGV